MLEVTGNIKQMPPQPQPGQNPGQPNGSDIPPIPNTGLQPPSPPVPPQPQQPIPAPIAPEPTQLPPATLTPPPTPPQTPETMQQPTLVSEQAPMPPVQPQPSITPTLPPQPDPVTPQPSNYATAPGNLSANTPSGAFVGSDGAQLPFTPQKFGLNQSSKSGLKGKFGKKPIIALIVVALLGIGFVAFWFGYYNNPTVVYSQAMKNTNKGYEKLIEYAKNEDGKNYKSASGTGKLNIKTQGTNITGTMNYKSSANNSQFNAVVDLGVAKVNADVIQINNPKNGSDYYFKVSGIKSISSLAASPEINKIVSKTENVWIYVDPELAKGLEGSDQSSASLKEPTTEQMLDAANKVGEVNKKYLFTTNNDNAVLKVEKAVGKEEVDGHTAFKYEMSVSSTQASAWIKAQFAAIKSSKLYDWMKQNDFAKTFDSAADESAKGAKLDTKNMKLDMWVDAKTRLIYKIRIADKALADSYTDIGLDYKGGSKYPLFMTLNYKYGQDTTKIKFQLTLDSDTDAMGLDLDAVSTGSSSGTFKANFDVKPGNESFKIAKPANAKSLSQLLNELGYGEAIKELQASSAAAQ